MNNKGSVWVGEIPDEVREPQEAFCIALVKSALREIRLKKYRYEHGWCSENSFLNTVKREKEFLKSDYLQTLSCGEYSPQVLCAIADMTAEGQSPENVKIIANRVKISFE